MAPGCPTQTAVLLFGRRSRLQPPLFCWFFNFLSWRIQSELVSALGSGHWWGWKGGGGCCRQHYLFQRKEAEQDCMVSWVAEQMTPLSPDHKWRFGKNGPGNGEAAWVYVSAFCFGGLYTCSLGFNRLVGGCVTHSQINIHPYKVNAYNNSAWFTRELNPGKAIMNWENCK